MHTRLMLVMARDVELLACCSVSEESWLL